MKNATVSVIEIDDSIASLSVLYIAKNIAAMSDAVITVIISCFSAIDNPALTATRSLGDMAAYSVDFSVEDRPLHSLIVGRDNWRGVPPCNTASIVLSS